MLKIALVAVLTLLSTSAASANLWTKFTLSADPNQKTSSAHIFVTLTNMSPDQVTFTRAAICWLTDLVVTDSHGVVQPQGQRRGCPLLAGARTLTNVLDPGASFTGFSDDDKQGFEFSAFGYSDLPPGSYTVRAIPSGRLAATADVSAQELMSLSNVVTITLHAPDNVMR